MTFPVFRDHRGELLPVELDDVPFAVRRVFWVRGADGGSERGGHRADCDELVVLLSGRAVFRHGPDIDAPTSTELGTPGARLLLRPGDQVGFELADAGSAILVLASAPYARKTGESP